ncbi:hypothetical protein [Flavobacterium terrisoli]|uniref:hypothetical protein n=1 Tax=Flavobacterium terrisoli TaxID=3242195 RepID=UPI0025439CA0|nr:hypothetical protein [Flavobacterium buctense]
MRKINTFLCLLLLVVSFSACESNDDSNSNDQNDDTFAENFGSEVSRNFIGQIVGTDNQPLQGATVQIGTSTVQTDLNGVFIINGANVHERFAYITVTKAGYIDGSRAMVPTNGMNNIKIMLIPNTPLETIQSGVPSEVVMPNGTKVVFDGAFQDENGLDYSGSVQVAMFHLLPSDENISKLMPGMLYAQTQSNEEAVLQTFGMLNVELRGSAGQKLNIKEGHTAEITLKIDDSQIGSAPNSIPLWHFDEAKGYWKEDGVATKVGNKYMGEVSHFSWWNCDASFPIINLTVTLVDSNGNSLPNAGIGLVANGISYNNSAMGHTDNNGSVSGLVPSNQTMTLNVYQECGIVFTTTIGPFNNDTVVPITLPNSSVIISKINGSLLKCNGSNVTNGYIVLSKNGVEEIINVTNGTFSFSTMFCAGATSFTLNAIDIDNLQAVPTSTHTIATPITNVGNLTACNSITEYLYYKLDNNPVKYIFSNKGGGYNSASLPFTAWGYDYSTGASLFVIGYSLVPGVYDSSVFQIDQLGGAYVYANENITFNLSKFGNIGQPIQMTLAGTFDDQYGVNHTVTATINVIRNQ